MVQRVLLWLVVLLVLLVMSGLWYWYVKPPARYQLHVVNNSQIVVQQVRLFGRGAAAAATLDNLMPGKTATLEVVLNPTGELRFEVSQRLNKIDTYLLRDVAVIEHYQQQLTIHPQNRFIISP